MTSNTSLGSRYWTPKGLWEEGFLSKAKVRLLLFERETNGLNVAVIKQGKSVYIHKERFFEWFESFAEVPSSKK